MTQITASLLGIGPTRSVDPIAAKRRAKRAEIRASGTRTRDWTVTYRTEGPTPPPPTHLEAAPTGRYGRPTDVLTFIDRHLPRDENVVAASIRRGRPADVLAYITRFQTPAQPTPRVTVADAPFVPAPTEPALDELWSELDRQLGIARRSLRAHPHDKQGVAHRHFGIAATVANSLAERGVDPARIRNAASFDGGVLAFLRSN